MALAQEIKEGHLREGLPRLATETRQVLRWEGEYVAAAFFDAAPALRQHPQHKIRVWFESAKSDFEIGEEVIVTMKIENLGEKPLGFYQDVKSYSFRDCQYKFTALSAGVNKNNVPCADQGDWMSSRKIIKPGEIYENTENLCRWFKFDKPGIYSLNGSYKLEIYSIESLPIPVTIWDDRASADFMVKIIK